MQKIIFRDGETVSQRTLDPLFYVQIVVPELMLGGEIDKRS